MASLRAKNNRGGDGPSRVLTRLFPQITTEQRAAYQLAHAPRGVDYTPRDTRMACSSPARSPRNMKRALRKTYDAISAPKIAVGACAIGGGPFVGHAEVNDGATDLVPIDLLIPGCPPHPLTILDGILRLLGRVDSGKPKPRPA